MPWCRRRCSYCDFYFEVGRAESDFSLNIMEEYQQRRVLWPKTPASTLYLGGGTPSLLSLDEMESLLNLRKDRTALSENAEITIEANPEDMNYDFVHKLKALGVNRISLGIQSFENSILRRLGRKHSAQMANECVELCTEAGFERVSVDLIFGVKGEDKQLISQSIDRLKDFGVGHISAYLLTIEQGTALAKNIEKGRWEGPDDDEQADSYEELQVLMNKSGFRQYEVSSFAIPGQESVHNRNYWGKGPYLGLGPAAHSMRLLQDGRIERSKNKSSIQNWRKDLLSPEIRETEILSSKEALLESISFGLRDLVLGVNLKNLTAKHCSAVPDGLLSILQGFAGRGWIIQDSNDCNNYRLTQLGVRFSDGIAREILNLP